MSTKHQTVLQLVQRCFAQAERKMASSQNIYQEHELLMTWAGNN